MPMNPNKPMMNSAPTRPEGQPMGLESLMSPEFQNRDRSGYEPLAQASPANLMGQQFQSRDRSGYEPLMAEGKSLYPNFGQPNQNNIAALRDMLSNAPAGVQPQSASPAVQQAQSTNPMGDEIENYFRKLTGGGDGM